MTYKEALEFIEFELSAPCYSYERYFDKREKAKQIAKEVFSKVERLEEENRRLQSHLNIKEKSIEILIKNNNELKKEINLLNAEAINTFSEQVVTFFKNRKE